MSFVSKSLPLLCPSSVAVSRFASLSLRTSPPRCLSSPRFLSHHPAVATNPQFDHARENTAARKEARRPWHRAGHETEPSERTSKGITDSNQGKGRLLTTPTRLLKLILPMPLHPDQAHINDPSSAPNTTSSEPPPSDKTAEPLALLVHPQQPLSYIASLLQAELPPLKTKGNTTLPRINFRAEGDPSDGKSNSLPGGTRGAAQEHADHGANVASYSGLGHEGPPTGGADSANNQGEGNWVRWSGSTEVGDFIRDAARGREFAIDIEGLPHELRVKVPSFRDRTYYMRQRLKRMSSEIEAMSSVKKECDLLAHRSAHRIAKAGFGLVGAWWFLVYYGSFHTELTWDTMEPITYLAGLVVIMAGYWYFLYVSRDLSYKAAMNVTVSRRQNALYQARGFNLQHWEQVVQEANALRAEIRVVAQEYAVDWDEAKDVGGEDVKEILEKEIEKDDAHAEKKKQQKREQTQQRREDEQHEKMEHKAMKEATS